MENWMKFKKKVTFISFIIFVNSDFNNDFKKRMV